MIRKALSIAACLLALAGCASKAPAPPISQLPWHDQTFAYDPASVTVTRDDLFRLEPDLLALLASPEVQQLGAYKRLNHLMTMILGPKRQNFAYAAGHTTIASETWRLKQGDCLSLSILAFAMARAAGMVSQIQEVDVPAVYDRRGTIDFVNQHVNVLFLHVRRGMTDGVADYPDLVVDFDPVILSNRRGRPLDENAVLARHYNNLGVEHLAAGRQSLAYAHFKAAIATDPGFGASYTNLAVLYRNASLLRDAEALLTQAVALSEPADVALQSMYQLLTDEGRDTEAQQYAKRLKDLRDRDPYYWLAVGIHHLQEGENRQAVRALETALDIAYGFPEVHRYLAVAYWRLGNQSRANAQLDALARLDRADPTVSTLRKKFSSTQPTQQ